MEPFTISATRYPGGAVSMTADQAVRELQHGTVLTWIHVEVNEAAAAAAWLQESLGFHPLHVEDALSTNERPGLSIEANQVFLSAPTVMPHNGDGACFGEIGLFVGQHWVVSVSGHHPTIHEWMGGPVGRRPIASVGMLVHHIVDQVVDDYFPFSDHLSDRVDELEDAVFRGESEVLNDALALKRHMLDFRRRVAPVRDVLNALLRRDVPWLAEDSTGYFQDVYDHSLRVLEAIDMERDILSGVLDAQLAITSNRLNVVMRSMTVISTLLMTAALVAGVYGMNFHFMPELSWVWGYPISLSLMVVLGAGELWLFRRWGWF